MPENLFKSRRFLFLWASAFVINIIAFLVIYSNTGLNGPNVALRYTVKAGVIWYGQGSNLYALPLLAFAANLVNFLLFRKLASHQDFLLYATVITSIMVAFFILISIIFLAAIN